MAEESYTYLGVKIDCTGIEIRISSIDSTGSESLGYN